MMGMHNAQVSNPSPLLSESSHTIPHHGERTSTLFPIPESYHARLRPGVNYLRSENLPLPNAHTDSTAAEHSAKPCCSERASVASDEGGDVQ